MEELNNKDALLKRLRIFRSNPDDDNIRIKQIIYNTFLKCPELLYALNETSLEDQLFCEDGTINYDGEWDLYFSDSTRDGNIRPYIFIPQTQTEVHNYVCYQTNFEQRERMYNSTSKYGLIYFNIMVHGADRMDKLTGIPRHDLIGAIIKDNINWTNLFGTQCHVISDKESITDNNYIVRSIVFEINTPNSIVQTSYDTNGRKISSSSINNVGKL